MKLYTKDGVFMPQHIPTVIGYDAIEKCYTQIFKTIHLQVDFNVIEVQSFDDEWAFARTTSAGVQTDLKSGNKSHEGNQELFVLQKVSGEWLIARYCFCTTNPPK